MNDDYLLVRKDAFSWPGAAFWRDQATRYTLGEATLADAIEEATS